MRIGLVVPGFSADADDWCIPALRDLVRVLARDHAVDVVALRYPFDAAHYRVDGAHVTSLGGRAAAGAARVPLLVRAVRAVLARHRSDPFDILHGLWADEAGPVAVAAATRARVPAVVSFMGGELVALDDIAYGGSRSRVNRLLTRIATPRAAGVTAGSRQLADQVTRATGCGMVTEMPLGVDTERFAADGAIAHLTGDPVLLQVASLTGVKDHATTLRSLPTVLATHPDTRLHLVGAGPERASIAQLADDLAIADHVHLHGHVPHERLPAMYRAARLHVQSSRFESQGMAVLEAAACGCPSAGSDVGVLPEVVPSRHVAPPGDPAGLAHAMLAALDESAVPRGLPGRYALDRTSRDLVSLYARVIRDQGR